MLLDTSASIRDNDLYFKNLDGLRAIAAFSVIFYHLSFWFDYPHTLFYDLIKFVLSFGGHGGEFGVIFFFILSGFLITYLMFSEQSKSGSINIPFFYYRRIIRIWPLYYFTLLVGFLIYPLISQLNGHVHLENASILLYSVFAANFDHIHNGNPSVGILSVQWSVSIEEQFYLLWPLVFYLFGKRKAFPFLLIFIIIISELFFLKAETWNVRYYHLISNFRFLAFGGFLACICYCKSKWIEFALQYIGPKTSLIVYLVCLLMMFFQQQLSESLFYFKYLYHILPFLFFGFVIIEQNFSNRSYFKIGSSYLLTWLGKISYGLYLTHMIAIYIVLSLFSASTSRYVGWAILLSVILTVVISYLSYTWLESFFLSLRNRFPTIITASRKLFNCK